MKKIIIIDDDAAIRDAFELVFERAGYLVTCFADEKQVLAGSFEEPDIFVIDRQLRGADGFDLCRFLKSRIIHQTTPIILFSAGPHIEKKALEAGADAFIEKPFANKTILDLAEKLIRINIEPKPTV